MAPLRSTRQVSVTDSEIIQIHPKVPSSSAGGCGPQTKLGLLPIFINRVFLGYSCEHLLPQSPQSPLCHRGRINMTEMVWPTQPSVFIICSFRGKVKPWNLTGNMFDSLPAWMSRGSCPWAREVQAPTGQNSLGSPSPDKGTEPIRGLHPMASS